jgi:putative DNA primase/helicase
MPNTHQQQYEGIEGTKGNHCYDAECKSSLEKITGGMHDTDKELQTISSFDLELIVPSETPPESPIEPEIKRPSFMVYEDWTLMDGNLKQPGLYWHGYTGGKEPTPIDIWVCSPIYADAIGANEQDESFGLLLRFMNSFGKWREWAMPMHLLKGNGDEMRGELLNLGVKMNLEAKKHLNTWLMLQHPTNKIISAARTGWSSDGKSFVMPHRILGDTRVRFQSEYAVHDDFIQRGDLASWRESIAVFCRGNPVLLLAISASFAAPLLLKAKQQSIGGGGIHLIGKSSRGKTTALLIAASLWGAPSYVRSWRATANGLEAIAAALNDSLLILDEISECDPREIGTIIYALANGQGKQRAKRSGSSRESARWRSLILSSGERTLSAHMQEAGQKIKAGQEARLLNIPVTERACGVFDELHGFDSGRAFADYMKRTSNQFYGVAGPLFIEKLLEDVTDLPGLYADLCNHPAFSTLDGVESRASAIFALIALAGEKATEYGLTGWGKDEVLNATIEMFNVWRHFRGQGQTETQQILREILDYIDKHGDSRFSSILETNNDYKGDNIDQRPVVRERAGYWKDTDKGRIFMFNSAALQEAAKGHDLKFILQALNEVGWIVEKESDKNSKRIKIAGRSVSLYWIRPKDEGPE